ncbi:MAG: outer membrane protein transport protein [Candidatus Omnitrophota bacterium]|jgi:long-chain fatty acid transport protein
MKKAIFALLLGLGLTLPINNAFAAGSGAFRIELVDAASMGKGAAVVAQADNPAAIYYNPAGMTQLDGKLNVSLGASVFQPFTTYKDDSGNETDMRRQVFTIPNFLAVSNFGLEKFAFGIGETSNWGTGTYWAEDSFSKYVATKSEISSNTTMLTAAYKINENLSLGVAADWVMLKTNSNKKLDQSTLGGSYDGNSQLKGKDNNAWGYRLSALYKLNKNHSFGFMYRSPIEVKYKGKLYLDDLSGYYAGVFGGGSYETDVTSKMTLPQSILLGYCFKPDDKWRFEFDTEWMDWASIKEQKIDYTSESDATRLYILNTGNPTAKNWHSVFSYALGAEYKVNDIWKLRAGYYFHKTPIAQANFETSLPDATSNSITIGTGINLNKNITLDFAYSAMFFDKRKIESINAETTGINGEYHTFDNIYMLTLTFKL